MIEKNKQNHITQIIIKEMKVTIKFYPYFVFAFQNFQKFTIPFFKISNNGVKKKEERNFIIKGLYLERENLEIRN